MAKQKISMKKLQKDYEERMAKQRKNKNNWPGMVLAGKTDKSIQEANDVIFEGRTSKYYSKMGKMIYK